MNASCIISVSLLFFMTSVAYDMLHKCILHLELFKMLPFIILHPRHPVVLFH